MIGGLCAIIQTWQIAQNRQPAKSRRSSPERRNSRPANEKLSVRTYGVDFTPHMIKLDTPADELLGRFGHVEIYDIGGRRAGPALGSGDPGLTDRALAVIKNMKQPHTHDIPPMS